MTLDVVYITLDVVYIMILLVAYFISM